MMVRVGVAVSARPFHLSRRFQPPPAPVDLPQGDIGSLTQML
jgi:hypothetical protein